MVDLGMPEWINDGEKLVMKYFKPYFAVISNATMGFIDGEVVLVQDEGDTTYSIWTPKGSISISKYNIVSITQHLAFNEFCLLRIQKELFLYVSQKYGLTRVKDDMCIEGLCLVGIVITEANTEIGSLKYNDVSLGLNSVKQFTSPLAFKDTSLYETGDPNIAFKVLKANLIEGVLKHKTSHIRRAQLSTLTTDRYTYYFTKENKMKERDSSVDIDIIKIAAKIIETK